MVPRNAPIQVTTGSLATRRSGSSPMVDHVYGMCDPFSDQSRGCLIKDECLVPRLPVRAEVLKHIAPSDFAGATEPGNVAFWWLPGELTQSFGVTPTTSGTPPNDTWSAPSTWTSIVQAAWPSGASQGRRTCSGIKIRPNSVATATAGTIIVTEVFYPQSSYSVGSMQGTDVKSYAAVPGLEITLLSRPTGPASRLPQVTNFGSAPSATTGASAFSGFFVQFIGFPTTANVDIQIVEAAEAFIDSSVAVAQYVPAPPKPNPAVQALADRVRHEVGAVLQTGVGAVSENLRARIGDALRREAAPVRQIAGRGAQLMLMAP